MTRRPGICLGGRCRENAPTRVVSGENVDGGPVQEEGRGLSEIVSRLSQQAAGGIGRERPWERRMREERVNQQRGVGEAEPASEPGRLSWGSRSGRRI